MKIDNIEEKIEEVVVSNVEETKELNENQNTLIKNVGLRNVRAEDKQVLDDLSKTFGNSGNAFREVIAAFNREQLKKNTSQAKKDKLNQIETQVEVLFEMIEGIVKESDIEVNQVKYQSNKEIETIKNEYEELSTKHKKSLDDFQDVLLTKNREITNKDLEIKELKEKIEKIEQEKSILADKNKTFDTVIKGFEKNEKELTELKSEIEPLRKENSKLLKENEEHLKIINEEQNTKALLESKLNNLEDKINDKEKQLTNIGTLYESQVSDLKTIQSENKIEIKELNSKINELTISKQIDMNNLKSDFENQISSLKKEIEEYKIAIAGYEKKSKTKARTKAKSETEE